MLKEILNIGNYPYLNRDHPFFEKIIIVLKTYGLVFLSLLFVGPFANIADHLVTRVLHYKSIIKQDNIAMDQMIHKLGYWWAMGTVCLLGPLLEETVFRLPLSFKRIHVALAMALGSFVGGNVVFRLLHSNRWITGSLTLALPVLVFLAIRYLVPYRLGEKITPYNKKHVIILYICVFGLMHISNYSPIQWPIIFIYPVYVLPQICMGWGMSYIRFKNGFFWGVGLHCLINTLAMVLYARFK